MNKTKFEDGLFDRMMEEAVDEIANGNKGWKEVDSNVLLMACFGCLSQKIIRCVSRPMWFFAGVVATGLIWAMVDSVLNIS